MRCPDSAGRFRFTFIALHEPDGYTVKIPGHPDVRTEDGRVIEVAPLAVSGPPHDLEFCIHEMSFLRDGVPGRDYRLDYKFILEPLP